MLDNEAFIKVALKRPKSYSSFINVNKEMGISDILQRKNKEP